MQYGSVPIRDRSGRADEDGLKLVPFPRCPSIVVNDLEMFLDQDACGASTPVPPGVILSSALEVPGSHCCIGFWYWILLPLGWEHFLMLEGARGVLLCSSSLLSLTTNY